jgi:hypothetical protein
MKAESRDAEIEKLFEEFSLQEIFFRHGLEKTINWENALSLGKKKLNIFFINFFFLKKK